MQITIAHFHLILQQIKDQATKVFPQKIRFKLHHPQKSTNDSTIALRKTIVVTQLNNRSDNLEFFKIRVKKTKYLEVISLVLIRV